jgi:glutathione S-transferase
VARRFNGATDEAARRDLAALPGLVDRVDELIERGVIGGAEPNAADFQIATSLSLLLTMDDVRPLFEGHPAEGLARDIVPDQPGRMPSVYQS